VQSGSSAAQGADEGANDEGADAVWLDSEVWAEAGAWLPMPAFDAGFADANGPLSGPAAQEPDPNLDSTTVAAALAGLLAGSGGALPAAGPSERHRRWFLA
jgi:hypothetical protein